MKHLLMKRLLPAAALVLALTATASAAPAPERIAGYDRLTVKAAHRPEPLAASIWYPLGTRTYRGLIRDNAVFKGTFAYVGAAIRDGKYPLLLLSHGSGGNMDSLAWLSSALALRGALVLAVNHPGSTSGDSSPRRSVQLKDRAADLSAALDTILQDPAFAKHIDTSRITSIGFSLGGATALNLAGLRFDGTAYRRYCDAFGKQAEDCLFLAKGGVDLANLPASFAADMRDPRISAAIAIDPGFSYAATDNSIAAMDLPVLLVSLGRKNLFKAADVGPKGSNLAGRLPNVTRAVIAPAHHYTFLAECKPEGAAILKAERDDPVCDDPEGTDRAKAHRNIVKAIAAFLQL